MPISADTIKARLKRIQDFPSSYEWLKKAKKSELLDNYQNMVWAITDLDSLVFDYIREKVDKERDLRTSRITKLEAKYRAEHIENLKLKKQLQQFKTVTPSQDELQELNTVTPRIRKESTGRKVKYKADTAKEIARLRADGHSIRFIAALLNMSPTTVQKIIKQCANK